MTHLTPNVLSLADWRRQISEIYAEVRRNPNAEDAWRQYRRKRDALFATHPQSPLTDTQKTVFRNLPYFPYNPDWRIHATIDSNVTAETFRIHLPNDGDFSYTRIARVHFQAQAIEHSLSLFWVEGYGGGLFLPFRDKSNGQSSYGGGRYLYDGIKGADLNIGFEKFVLDFNFAYNPSCGYNDHWVCPLSPPENRLRVAINAGEKSFQKT